MSTGAKLQISHESWPIAGGFRIARGAKTHADVLVATLTDDNGLHGRGECVPYARYGESIPNVTAQINAMSAAINDGLTCEQLQSALPAGAARNALDCAMWDLHSQQTRQPVWVLAGVSSPDAVTTAFTVSLGTPDAMATAAAFVPQRPVLKIKLAGDTADKLRVLAIANARPDAGLILDGNEGFSLASLQALIEPLQKLRILAIEQPLPAGDDEALRGLHTPFALCADESLHTSDDLPRISTLYDMINVKLDKTGGLTHALALVNQAQKLNLQIMVGCMVATSLSMAPALLVANHAALVDLDGPLLLERDRNDGLLYDEAVIPSQSSPLWGYPRRR